MTSIHALLLKLRLLNEGLRVHASAERVLSEVKPGLRTRSGVSGGLDLVLPGHVHVNSAIAESFAHDSSLVLHHEDFGFVLYDGDSAMTRVGVYPRPAYYDQVANDGIPMVEIGQMCSGDRICIGMAQHCVFWRRVERCKFCTIGRNAPLEAARKTPKNIAETVATAAVDSILPARHVLIGGGTPNDQDRGAHFAAAACEAIKKRLDISIYVMIAPPSDLDDIERLRDSGADELGMNLEFFTDAALRTYAPGKHARIGHEHAYRALERAVKVFGPVNTRSIAIVGLEPAQATIEGAERLASMGVMPILSPFRPMDGSMMADARGFDPSTLAMIHDEVVRRCSHFGIVPGPTCIPCQNNTLAMPHGEAYHYYGEPWEGVNAVGAAEVDRAAA